MSAIDELALCAVEITPLNDVKTSTPVIVQAKVSVDVVTTRDESIQPLYTLSVIVLPFDFTLTATVPPATGFPTTEYATCDVKEAGADPELSLEYVPRTYA